MKYVTYYRVSTKSQGESGLGLSSQRRDIKLFLEGADYEIVEEITDVQSGKGTVDERPELQRAIELAKEHNAVLLVSKLDRLSRRVSVVATLTDDNSLKIKVAQMPNADSFQLHIYAALAQQEREFISKRTKAALQEAKARGVKLGGYKGDSKARKEAQAAKALNSAEKYRLEFQYMMKHGLSVRAMADSLNERCITTPKNSTFSHTTVQRMLKRLELR